MRRFGCRGAIFLRRLFDDLAYGEYVGRGEENGEPGWELTFFSSSDMGSDERPPPMVYDRLVMVSLGVVPWAGRGDLKGAVTAE